MMIYLESIAHFLSNLLLQLHKFRNYLLVSPLEHDDAYCRQFEVQHKFVKFIGCARVSSGSTLLIKDEVTKLF